MGPITPTSYIVDRLEQVGPARTPHGPSEPKNTSSTNGDMKFTVTVTGFILLLKAQLCTSNILYYKNQCTMISTW